MWNKLLILCNVYKYCVFIFIRVDNTALQILIRILLIPVIAGVSYEVIRWAGKNDNAFVRVLSKPGMWFQKLTTREPDMDMIEVAIRAVEEVFDWRQFIAEYYSEADNPVEALVASEAELAISGSLIHGNEETRTIDIEEQKSEDNQETELTPEQKYLQMGRRWNLVWTIQTGSHLLLYMKQVMNQKVLYMIIQLIIMLMIKQRNLQRKR